MLEPGQRIDEWVVDGPLGAGGTASVYACHNVDAPRVRAAVKVLDERALKRLEARARLVREGEVLHGLEHPNIVRVFGVRAESDPPYLVMALVEGPPLSKRLREGPVEEEERVRLFESLSGAVAYLHERGIQHRDLKPHNILMNGDEPVLVDFGLVLEDGASRLTAEGLRIGTVSYVPPEWKDPTRIDPVKWDVYSLGVIFWEAVVGRRAFPIDVHLPPTQAALEVLQAKQGHPPLDPGPDVPFFMRMLVRDMTHPNPAARPVDACEVLARLQAGEAGAGMDPIDLFQTPMPSQYHQELVSAPTLSSLTPGATQMPEGSGVRHSFLVGALLGGVFVAIATIGALIAWRVYVVNRLASDVVTIEVPASAPAVAPPPAAPEPRPVAAEDPPPAGVPSAVDTPAAGGTAEAAPGPVAASDFAGWLTAHPDWARDATIARGQGTANYLAGWEKGAPAGAAVAISWHAAAAYCEGRGGLAAVDAEPQRWERNAANPYMEWRVQSGRPAWRTADGRHRVEAVDPLTASAGMGLRCTR